MQISFSFRENFIPNLEKSYSGNNEQVWRGQGHGKNEQIN